MAIALGPKADVPHGFITNVPLILELLHGIDMDIKADVAATVTDGTPGDGGSCRANQNHKS
ncbi:MAG: hypothetical protein HOC23_12450 [Halieaceae bacterium]|jgi:hypothetical protein|nr:hypothetical protein [Halieaceae bacterium]